MLLHDPSILGLIKQRLDPCHQRARGLIAQNRVTVEAVACRLEEAGYLDQTAISECLKDTGFDGRPSESAMPKNRICAVGTSAFRAKLICHL